MADFESIQITGWDKDGSEKRLDGTYVVRVTLSILPPVNLTLYRPVCARVCQEGQIPD